MKKIILFLMTVFWGFLGFSQINTPITFVESEPAMRLTEKADVHFYRGKDAHKRMLRAYKDTLYSFDMNNSIPTNWFVHDNTGHGYVFYWDTVGPIGAYTGYPNWNDPAATLASTTGRNGFLKFPADAYNTDSSTGKIKSDYINHDSYIQTSALDFTNKPNIILYFQERFRVCCTYTDANLYMEVSNDSVNWTRYKVASPYAAINEHSSADSSATLVEINISKVAANQSKVWVRWHINGLSHYYWMLDDVAFIEGPKDDIVFDYYVPQFYGDNWYRLLPMKQTTPVTVWKSTIFNNGYNTATGVNLNIEVTNTDGITVHSFSYDTLDITGAADTIAPFETDTVEPNSNYAFQMDTTATNHYAFKTYLSMDASDQETSNDTAQELYLDITDTVMARAIVNTSSVGIGNYVGTSSGDVIGTAFYIPNKDTVSSVTFYISPNTDTEDVSFDITLSIWDGSSWVNDIVTSADPISVTGDMLGKWVTVPFYDSDFDRTIEAGTPIIVGIKQYYDLSTQKFQIGANTQYTHEEGYTNGGRIYINGNGSWGGISPLPTIRLNFKGPDCIIMSYTKNDVADCYGDTTGEATIFVTTGTAPYDYRWSTGDSLINTYDSSYTLSNLASGYYTVTITDSANCSKTKTIAIFQPEELIATASIVSKASSDSTCDGVALVTATGGTGIYQYAWNDRDSQTTDTAKNLCVATYVVTVTDENHCSSIDWVTILADTNATSDSTAIFLHDNELENISLYPNPNDGSFTVTGNHIVAVNIYNANGQLLEQRNMSSTNRVFLKPTDKLIEGIYFVKIVTKDAIVVKKIMVK